MTDYNAKQRWIDKRRQIAITEYPRQWSRMIERWQEDSDEDCAFLTYSANYLFRTAGARWAIDPLTLQSRVPASAPLDLARDLSKLEFVILTHEHADHLDEALIHELRNTSIQWVVPKSILSRVLQLGVGEKNIIIPEDRQTISLSGVNIVPFNGRHWQRIPRDEMVEIHGVPSTSYMVELNGKHWLFPGDVRDYEVSAFPGFGVLDGIFAHLWLGRKSALMEPPPLVDPFCSFFTSLGSKGIVITHLEEFGRNALDYWDQSHYELVRSRIQNLAPGIHVSAASMGDVVHL